MKIAGAIGIDEMRSGLVSSPPDFNTSAASFAESFGKEMIATSEKAPSELDVHIPRHIASTNFTLVKPDGSEAAKKKPQEMLYAKQADKGGPSSEPTQIVKKTVKDISADAIARGVIDGDPSRDEQDSSQAPSKLSSGEIPVRIFPKGVPLIVPPDEIRQSVKQKTTHPGNEYKYNIRIQGASAPHKLVKIGNAENYTPEDRINDVQVTTNTPLLQSILVATPAIEPEAQDSAVATTISAKDSPSVAVPSIRVGRTHSRKVQISDAKDSLVPLTAGGVAKQAAASDSLPEGSDHESCGAKPSSRTQMRDGSAILSPAEKSHMELSEVSQATGSTVTQVPEHPIVVRRAENVVPASVHVASGQENIVTNASHIYAADEHKTLMATSTTLEVGLQAGSHGWLKVRAELTNDGAVQASVTSNSSAGTEMLRRELPSLTSYLHQEQIPIHSVAIHAPSDAMDLSNAFAGGGQNQETGRETAEGQRDSRDQRPAALGKGEKVSLQEAAENIGAAGWPLSIGRAGAGGWLNVRA